MTINKCGSILECVVVINKHVPLTHTIIDYVHVTLMLAMNKHHTSRKAEINAAAFYRGNMVFLAVLFNILYWADVKVHRLEQ